MAVSIWEGSKAQGLIDAIKESGGTGKEIAMITDIGMCALECLENSGWVNENGTHYIDKLYNAIHSNGNMVDSITVVPKDDIEVYTHNNIEDLRRMIYVIGSFNGIEVTVNGYRLSGDISTAGNKTITVEYMGKTTTFTVSVAAGIPNTYSALDWLELDSDKARGVAERYSLANNQLPAPDAHISFKNYSDVSRIGYDVLFSGNKWSLTVTAPIFGYRERGTGITTNTHMNAIYYSRLGGLTLSVLGKEWGVVQSYVTKGVNKARVRFDGKNCYCQLNDLPASNVVEVLADTYAGAFVPMFVPNKNITTGVHMNVNYTTHIGARVGMIKLYQGENMIGKYIPCMRKADGVLGYYEMVEGVFYTTGDSAYANTLGDKCVYSGGKW